TLTTSNWLGVPFLTMVARKYCEPVGCGNFEPVLAATVRLVDVLVIAEASVVEALFVNSRFAAAAGGMIWPSGAKHTTTAVANTASTIRFRALIIMTFLKRA